ncbi:MAG: hypothetical protein ACRD9Q_06475 [Nitrososphaeraceae archaeon]
MSRVTSEAKFRLILYDLQALEDALQRLQNSTATNSLKEIRTNSQILLLKKSENQSQVLPLIMSEFADWLENYKDLYEEPVRVDHSQGEERLIYKSKKMEVGKLYKVTWQGKKLALSKTSEGIIDLYEFVPDQ